jgi:hypothetical protein
MTFIRGMKNWFDSIPTLSHYQQCILNDDEHASSNEIYELGYSNLKDQLELFQSEGLPFFFDITIDLFSRSSFSCSEEKRLYLKYLNNDSFTPSDYECLVHFETLHLYKKTR